MFNRQTPNQTNGAADPKAKPTSSDLRQEIKGRQDRSSVKLMAVRFAVEVAKAQQGWTPEAVRDMCEKFERFLSEGGTYDYPIPDRREQRPNAEAKAHAP